MKDKKIKLLSLIIIIIFLIGFIFYYSKNNEENLKNDDITYIEETTTQEKRKEKNYIDIKGSVKNPGVYEFKENDRVIDAIKYAGGLIKNANTSNINLSQKLKSEMVIYVYNNNEIKNNNNISCNTICETNVIEVNNCIDDKKDNLVNINTATMEELMSLTGIGESKAKNIIKYREENGLFKSVEEIKNISGIGDTLFNQIKDNISI